MSSKIDNVTFGDMKVAPFILSYQKSIIFSELDMIRIYTDVSTFFLCNSVFRHILDIQEAIGNKKREDRLACI